MDRPSPHARIPTLGSPRGWTLIEQLMLVAIVAVLASIAVPPMQGMLARSRLRSAQMDLIAGLQQARYLAISRGLPAIFCPSRDGGTCRKSSRWEQGWLIAIDRDGNDQPDRSVLYTGPHAPGDMRVRSSSGRYRVRFHPDGSAAGSNLTITLCLPHDEDRALNVVVSNPGRVRGEPASTAQTAACSGNG